MSGAGPASLLLLMWGHLKEKKCGLDLPETLSGTWQVLRGCWWQEAQAPGEMWAQAVSRGPLSFLILSWMGACPPVRYCRYTAGEGTGTSSGVSILFGFGAQRAGEALEVSSSPRCGGPGTCAAGPRRDRALTALGLMSSPGRGFSVFP